MMRERLWKIVIILHKRAFLRRAWLIAMATLVALAALAGCGQEAPPPAPSGGGFNPESVAQSFFEDFGQALQDPNLAREETRDYWVERLANYFAPSERDDQRIALASSLASFANGLGELADNEAVVFELHGFNQLEKVSDDGTHAIVRLPSASIYMALTRSTEEGTRPFYEQTISLGQVTGRADGSVPMIKVDGRWYLTEG